MSNNIIEVIHKINDAFNEQNVQPFKDYVQDNVVIHRIGKDGKVIQKIGKQEYLSFLKETWEQLKNPKSTNLTVTTRQVGDTTKAVIIYDSSFTPPGHEKVVTEPATALMYFNPDGKLIDATYATR